MKNLFELIADLPESEWNYYHDFNNNVPLAKPIVSPITSRDFIIAYYHKGGKEEAMQDFMLGKFSKKRADHTVSIFFFGLLVYHNTFLKEKISFDGKVNELYNFFQFIWFLTCLSHDAAFDREYNKELVKSCRNLDAFKSKFNIDHVLTDLLDIRGVPLDMFALCDKYFLYRRDCGAVDHGIHAGLLMYDRMVKNREMRHSNNYNKLFWQPALDPQYAFAAATVMLHNMWVSDEKTEQVYVDHELFPLIKRSVLRPSEGPLLYLLDLVDTIDPVKLYQKKGSMQKISAKKILKNVFISFPRSDQFLISIGEVLCFHLMEKTVDKLTTWMDISYTVSDRSILITIPNT